MLKPILLRSKIFFVVSVFCLVLCIEDEILQDFGLPAKKKRGNVEIPLIRLKILPLPQAASKLIAADTLNGFNPELGATAHSTVKTDSLKTEQTSPRSRNFRQDEDDTSGVYPRQRN